MPWPFSKTRERKRVEQIEALANSCQLELYKTLLAALERKYDRDVASNIAAGLSNHIMQFGLANKQHTSDAIIRKNIQNELEVCSTYIDYKFQQNMLGYIILLASAWKIPLDKFTGHIRLFGTLERLNCGWAANFNDGQHRHE